MPNKCNLNLMEIKIKVSENSWSLTDFREEKFPNNSLYNSAVLVPLVVNHGEVNLLFTLRSSSLDRHSGQVSFPGGIIESNDNSPIDTALRETEEEIGIRKGNIQIIGQLIPLNTSTGYFVYPVVGIIDSLENIRRNQVEVDRIFYIPLNWLCDPVHSRLKDYISDEGEIRNVWFFDLFEGDLLWGITAKITHDLIEIIIK